MIRAGGGQGRGQLPADDHVHTQFSYDTGPDASMLASCARAVALGIPAVAFTEHLDFTVWGPGDARPAGVTGRSADFIAPIDLAGYHASVAECRERFPDLLVRSGVEAGEPHLFPGSVAAVLRSGTFERVVGSLHAVAHESGLVEVDALYDVLPADEVMDRYVAELLRLVEGSDVFEVLGHVDYPRRYRPAGPPPYDEARHEEGYRAVLRALASSDRVLEINTKSPLASLRLLGWWRDAGGRALSFGSDAHQPWLVGTAFDRAVAVAHAAGFRPGRRPVDFWVSA